MKSSKHGTVLGGLLSRSTALPFFGGGGEGGRERWEGEREGGRGGRGREGGREVGEGGRERGGREMRGRERDERKGER